jgi:predicted RNase H-like HicB family nuclease
MRYAVVIEKAETNYSAYVPDLPGCVATGSSVKEVEKEIRDAIRFHIEGLKEDRSARARAQQHRGIRRSLTDFSDRASRRRTRLHRRSASSAAASIASASMPYWA